LGIEVRNDDKIKQSNFITLGSSILNLSSLPLPQTLEIETNFGSLIISIGVYDPSVERDLSGTSTTTEGSNVKFYPELLPNPLVYPYENIW
jgi:hypothetical protein